MKCKKVIVNIPINELYPHPDNPRKDIGDITELTKSIKTAGMIYQNLTVIKGHYENGELAEGGYTIIMGHRRTVAAKKAGLTELPAKIIEDVGRKEQIAMMLEENMQRNDLTIIEQADSFQMMLDLGETVDTLAKKTGFSKQTVKHRVELAKLDKELFREKEENEYFQMSLKDIYELEKIEDIEVRNRILKECSSSNQIEWRVKQAITAEENKKKEAIFIKQMEDMGITKAPIKSSSERYSGKWDEVKCINLDDAIEKGITLKKSKDPYYWYINYNWVYILKLHKKTKGEVEAELMKKDKAKARKELERLKESVDGQIKSFLTEMSDGKIKDDLSSEDTNEMYKRAWSILVNGYDTNVTYKNILAYLDDKSKWLMDIDYLEENRSRLLNMKIITQMLICAAADLKERDIKDYNLHYEDEHGKRYQDFIELMSKFGFGLNNEEEVLLVFGEHELFEKKGEA